MGSLKERRSRMSHKESASRKSPLGPVPLHLRFRRLEKNEVFFPVVKSIPFTTNRGKKKKKKKKYSSPNGSFRFHPTSGSPAALRLTSVPARRGAAACQGPDDCKK